MNSDAPGFSSASAQDREAIEALLELARAVMPDFQLHSVRCNPSSPADDALGDERLRQVEARYRTLVEQFRAVTFIASFEDGSSEIFLSPHIETLLGYSAEEWTSDPTLWYQRLHPDDKPRWNEEFARTIAHAQPFKADYRFLSKDNRVVWIHGEARLVHNAAGRPSFIQGLGYDITELKDAEEVLQRSRQELEDLVEARTVELEAVNQSLLEAKEEADRANRAKSEFLSRMSHELRTPLNAILGFGQLLEVDVTTPEDVESIQQVLKAGHHLLELINEVLDLAKIEAGRMSLSLEPINVAQLMRETLLMVGPLASARGITLSSSDSELFALGDRQRLMQVFLNLLSNAIKYNRQGGKVEISFVPEGESELRINVTDTGPGIAAEDLRIMFNPFERLNAAESEVEGTGLGLMVCKRLVELMDGEIGAESAVGVGSTFWVQLPQASKEPLPNELREIKPRWQSSVAGRQFSILYIEDNDSNARLLQRILQTRLGVHFLTCKRGLQGLELAREHLPDIILLDLYLPDIPGDQVLAQLRADEETASIPVLIITADATRGHAERLLAAGAQSYLTKPLEMSKFFAAIEEALARRAAGASES